MAGQPSRRMAPSLFTDGNRCSIEEARDILQNLPALCLEAEQRAWNDFVVPYGMDAILKQHNPHEQGFQHVPAMFDLSPEEHEALLVPRRSLYMSAPNQGELAVYLSATAVPSQSFDHVPEPLRSNALRTLREISQAGTGGTRIKQQRDRGGKLLDPDEASAPCAHGGARASEHEGQDQQRPTSAVQA